MAREATLRVLVVDDDEQFRASVIDALVAVGEVAAVATPAEAVWALSQARFDVLICDLRLGAGTSTSGDDVLEAVRSEWPGVARILVTGDPTAGREHPAHAVLHKPLDLGALRELLGWLPAAVASPAEVGNDNGGAGSRGARGARGDDDDDDDGN